MHEKFPKKAGFNREKYLGEWYLIDGLTPAQMSQIEQRDFSPLTSQLKSLPEGKARDRILFAMEDAVTDLVKKLDVAFDFAEECKDREAVAGLKYLTETMTLFTNELRSFCSGQ